MTNATGTAEAATTALTVQHADILNPLINVSSEVWLSPPSPSSRSEELVRGNTSNKPLLTRGSSPLFLAILVDAL